MPKLGSLPIRQVFLLAFIVEYLAGQFSIYEELDPEKNIPDSDITILSIASAVYDSLNPESASLLVQLSILTQQEVHFLESLERDEKQLNIDDFSRLKLLVSDLWSDVNIQSVNGFLRQRLVVTSGAQYRWAGEIYKNNFVGRFIGERDPLELDIFDYSSFFLMRDIEKSRWIIGNYQI